MHQKNTAIDVPLVTFTLNGQKVVTRADQTILQTADDHGIEVPRLCYMEGMRADGNCRTCMVEIKGERVLAASCCRYPKDGMEVTTNSARAVASQKMSLELLLSDIPETSYTLDSELDLWAKKMGIGKPRFHSRHQPVEDLSHPAMAVHLDACIQCKRCVRACREEQVNDVIGYAFRGGHSKIVFDLDDPMGNSTCVACGECVQACPTGALMPARDVALTVPDKTVDSVCPYCGVGCQLTYNVKNNKILFVQGKDGPANSSRLCVKGRYGFDYVQHKHRLTKPLIRKKGAPKHKDFTVDPEKWHEVFREATWEEALDFAAKGLRDVRDTYGKRALAGFGSAKGTNEEAYLFQKLVRTGFGSNNVDHCTRLCHASSVAALYGRHQLGRGVEPGARRRELRGDLRHRRQSDGQSSGRGDLHQERCESWRDADRRRSAARRARAPCHLLPAVQPRHRRRPAQRDASRHRRGRPRRSEVHRGPHVGIRGARREREEVLARSDGADLRHRRDRRSARSRAVYATSKASIILWGMGISQHVHGTDNARCLIALALATGQIGKPGSGLHPLRGQNNVQGASDSGLIPMFYPDYQRVNTPEARARFEKLWNTELDPDPGLTVVEIMNAAKRHEIRGMYIMGENPAMSDPDVDHAREAMAALDHVVVQDIFLTETAYLADVVLPATAWPEKIGTVTNTDRMVQLGRKAIEPPGDAREDFWLIVQLARRMGLDWQYTHPRDVFNEMRLCMDSIAGITWERLEEQSSVTYPCVKEGDPGDPVVFIDNFPTAIGSRQVRAGGPHLGGRASRCRVPDGLDHGTPARTLAHRVDDASRVGTRLHRTGAGRVSASAGSRRPRRRAWRHADDCVTPR